MKILLKVPYGNALLVSPGAHAAPLLDAVANAVLIKTEGYGKNAKFVISDATIEVIILKDDFQAEPDDIIKGLEKEKEIADARWIEYYNKSNKFEAELKNLKSDLDARGIAYTKDEVNPAA